MPTADKGVSSVISVILMVGIVVILSATVSVFVLDDTGKITEPAPNVAQSTGEFVAGSASDEQLVRITHSGGDSVAVEEIEIVVRASGTTLDTEARLVDLPAEGKNIDKKNIQGNKDLITKNAGLFGNPPDKTIIEEDSNVWSATDTIQFRVNSGQADFSASTDDDNYADNLEVVIVHTPTNAIIFEEKFTP